MTATRTDSTANGPGCPDAAVVERWIAELAATDRDVSDAERVDRIGALERLKGAAAAAQARTSADLDSSVRAHHAEIGLPKEQRGRGVAAQVALARRESPFRGGRHLGLARALVGEMPHTLAALTSGALSEWRATLLVRETACLTREARQQIDEILCADPKRIDGWGDKRLVAEAKKLAVRYDQDAVVKRAAKAKADRRVTIRPAPDTMAYLTALLPVEQAVACFSALTKEANTVRGGSDDRGRGQIMADTLVERVTGQRTATGVSVEVGLVITDRALLEGDDEPAEVFGYGTVPAPWARGVVKRLLDRAGPDGTDGADARVAVRRLFTHPSSGELVAMDSRQRAFPDGLGGFIDTRDGGICRTPFCDAPIRHRDHGRPHAAGGKTSAVNGQGLCEACNHAKQAPGWRARPSPDPAVRHIIMTTTPTGHTYRSQAPPLPGAPAQRGAVRRLSWRDLTTAS